MLISPKRKRGLIAAVLCSAMMTGCQKPPLPAPSPTGSASRPGWEIRYNAVTALARRGSDRIKDHLDILSEMLDEDQQLANFRTKLKDGREVPDEQAARSTVTSALKAVAELHEKKPNLDLSSLTPRIEKLTQSSSLIVRSEAERTRQILGKS